MHLGSTKVRKNQQQQQQQEELRKKVEWVEIPETNALRTAPIVTRPTNSETAGSGSSISRDRNLYGLATASLTKYSKN